MKTFIIRGAFLNPFELQNYTLIRDEFGIKAISSKYPISDKIDLPLVRLWSPTDLPNFPFKYPILNRIFTDAHQLYGLEKIVSGSDLVHVAETYFGYTHQVVLAKRRGWVKKVISTVWEIIPGNNEGIKGRKQYKRLAKENIDHFIAVTKLAKKCLIQEGVDENKITVIHVGIDISRFTVQKHKTKRSINILCVARLVPEKGVQDLLEAFLKIRETNRNVHLTFIGQGPLKNDLRGYKNVSVKQVPYNKIPFEYAKADIFCLPSRSTKSWQEQYGMCIVEAMACGLPIVTTNTGAIREVCGDTAIYTKHTNPDQLKANLEKLIYNESLRKEMGKEARERAESSFDCQKIARQIGDLYHKIICQ